MVGGICRVVVMLFVMCFVGFVFISRWKVVRWVVWLRVIRVVIVFDVFIFLE